LDCFFIRFVIHFSNATVSVDLVGLAQVPNIATADGTETLGPPNIDIASGSGIVAAGVGFLGTAFDGPGQPGTISVNVPGDIIQALLYWHGANNSLDNSTCNGVTGDNTVRVNGSDRQLEPETS